MQEILIQTGIGCIGGVTFALYGWYDKRINKKDLTVDGKKLLKTILVGAGIGAVAGYQGVEVSTLQGGAVFVAVTGLADKFTNTIFKFWKNKK